MPTRFAPDSWASRLTGSGPAHGAASGVQMAGFCWSGVALGPASPGMGIPPWIAPPSLPHSSTPQPCHPGRM